MMFYLSILRLNNLFKSDMPFACCFMLSFQHISKLGHWLLWECCIQFLLLIFNVLYKFLYTVFIAVHLHWKKASPYANVLCKHHPEATCVLIFFICSILTFRSVFIWFIFPLCFLYTGFKMVSKSAYSINKNLRWYWLS